MIKWDLEHANRYIHLFNELDAGLQEELLAYLNTHFPVWVYDDAVKRLRQAIANAEEAKGVLNDAVQKYPTMVDVRHGVPQDLEGYGIVFTAGGEGERLRLSLMQEGVAAEVLTDFTKATYPLDHFFRDYGALHANLCIVADICHTHRIDIPVVVTTGPSGSITARIIPQMLADNHHFGLKHLMVIAQESRLHLTPDEKIVYQKTENGIRPVTNPDETGGPIMKLKKTIDSTCDESCLDQLIGMGCTKLILLQGTAIYDPALLLNMAKAAKAHDALGVGIARKTFTENDPYGTFVVIVKNGVPRLMIVEQDIRNMATRELIQDGAYLPYNTGLYIFDPELLKKSDLPDYATPPKEILPELPRAPKVGFAATDILPLSQNPAILTISPDAYGVIKTSQDIKKLGQLGIRLGIDQICRRIYERI